MCVWRCGAALTAATALEPQPGPPVGGRILQRALFLIAAAAERQAAALRLRNCASRCQLQQAASGTACPQRCAWMRCMHFDVAPT